MKCITEHYTDSLSPLYIDPEARVLLVGPGAMNVQLKEGEPRVIPQDPNLSFLVSYVQELLVMGLDPGLVYAGNNDLEAMAEFTGYSQTCNIEYMNRNILWADDIGNFDVIIDHDTWKWVAMSSFNTDDNLERLIRNYRLLLRDNGKLIISTSTDFYGLDMHEFNTDIIEVIDKYKFKGPVFDWYSKQEPMLGIKAYFDGLVLPYYDCPLVMVARPLEKPKHSLFTHILFKLFKKVFLLS